MAQTSSNMSLNVWNLGTDYFNFSQLAANFNKIDSHNHTGSPNGVQIPAGGIANNAVTTATMANSSVTTDKIADLNVTTGKIADGAVTTAKASNTVVPAFQTSTTALPAGAVDGQLLWTTVNSTSAADDGSNTVTTYNTSWQFQYHLSSSQWRFIGGSPMIASNLKEISLTGSYAAIANTALTIPYKGIYQISLNGQLKNAGTTLRDIQVYFGTSTTATVIATNTLGSSNLYATINQTRVVSINSLTSPNNIYQIYALANPPATASIKNASLQITPVYVTL